MKPLSLQTGMLSPERLKSLVSLDYSLKFHLPTLVTQPSLARNMCSVSIQRAKAWDEKGLRDAGQPSLSPAYHGLKMMLTIVEN